MVITPGSIATGKALYCVESALRLITPLYSAEASVSANAVWTMPPPAETCKRKFRFRIRFKKPGNFPPNVRRGSQTRSGPSPSLPENASEQLSAKNPPGQ